MDGEYAVLQTIKRCVRAITTPEESSLLERGTIESYRKIAREVAPESAPEGRPQALDSLEAQIENVRSALDSLKSSNPGAGLEMAADLWHLWWTRGYVKEGEKRIRDLFKAAEDEAVKDKGQQLDPGVAARARAVLAHLIRHQGRIEEAKPLFEESLVYFQEHEQPALESMTRRMLAIIASTHDKNAIRAERLLDNSPGNPYGRRYFAQCPQDESAEVVYEIGNAARYRGVLLDAPGTYDEAAEEYDQAQKYLTDARDRFGRLENRRSQATASLAIANVLVKLGRLPNASNHQGFKEARKHYADALSTFESGRGDKSRLTLLHERAAHVGSLTGAWAVGAQMLGAAQRIRTETGSRLPEGDRHDFMTACEATLKERLGDDYERQIEAGKAMSQNEAIDKARAFLNAT